MRKLLLALLVLSVAAAIFISCAGGSSNSSTNGNPPPGNPGSVTVSISPASATVAAGASQQFSATVTGAGNTAVQWSVDGVSGGNSGSGTIDANGLYIAPAVAGTHHVTATSVASPGKSATAAVTVTASTSALVVSPASVHLAAGASKQFSATNSSGTPVGVAWSVDGAAGGNASVGTISPNGVYTAPANAGSHTVTATMQSNGATASASVLPPQVVFGNASVVTFHNDAQRTGQNLNESALTPASVNSKTFGKVFSLPVDGEVFAQPLYVPNLNVKGAAHNVLYVATEHDSVYAFDADGLSTAPLWHVNFPNAVPACGIQGKSPHFSPTVGITSTPAIDVAGQTIYVVAETLDSGVYTFRLHALDLTTGAEKFGGPVVIQASVPGTSPFASDNAGHVVLSPGAFSKTVLQREALLLANGMLYIGFGSQIDIEPYHGWLLAYDPHTLGQMAAFNSTPDGSGSQGGKGAFWQSGGGPATDTGGNVFATTGNGTFDAASGGRDYGDTVLKLSSSLSVEDWFTPFNEATLQQQDLDLGSAGLVVLPDQSSGPPHLLVQGSKEGRIYLINRDSLGHFNSGSDSQIVQEITGVKAAFSPPAYWNQNVYFGLVSDTPRQFSLASGKLTQVAQAGKTFHYPGATPSISANGNSNAIVWAIDSNNETNPSNCSALPGGGPSVLHAFDATNISHEFYNSAQAGSRDNAGPALRFTLPTVVNGHVYIGTQNNVTVYGFLP